MKMLAAYMNEIGKMEIGEVEKPQPKAKEVLVKLDYVGVCGSDGHYFHNGRCGSYVVTDDCKPFILGHECAGVVVELGEGVTDLQVGDKVALEPGITCGECEFCKSGRYNLCPDVVFLATPPVQGCNMEYIAFPANMCFKLPENVSTLEGALVEPLSVGVHAANQGDVNENDDVLILGAGCIGLVTLLACKAKGAKSITVVDLEESHLQKALEMGADSVINAKEKDTLEEVKRLTSGKGFNKVFETAGSKYTIAQTPFCVKRGGTIVLVGIAAEAEFPFNFGEIMDKEPTIKTVFRYRYTYPQAIADIAAGKIDVSTIATHKYAFEDIQKAYDEAYADKKNIIKAVIKVNKDAE